MEEVTLVEAKLLIMAGLGLIIVEGFDNLAADSA